MAIAQLPPDCPIEALALHLQEIGALGSGLESIVLKLSARSFLHASSLTFLCAWGRHQRQRGRRLLLRGDRSAIKRLEDLRLQEHLGLEYSSRRAASNPDPFVPLHLIDDEGSLTAAAQHVAALVTDHVHEGGGFQAALVWAVSELLDNVQRHADAREPGAAFARYFPRQQLLSVAISDLGRGILASLSESQYLNGHGHAVREAIQRGVTRSEDAGQGNGLAGVVEIVKRNGGTLRIWTGDVVYRISSREADGIFERIPDLPGTGVAFDLDTRRPVSLEDTWIAALAGGVPAMAGASAGDSRLTVAEPASAYGTGVPEAGVRQVVLDVALECTSTGMRRPAERLRERAEALLQEPGTSVSLDFHGVLLASSSFLDELVGRLALGIGIEQFRMRVRLLGMSQTIARMMEVVLTQRLRHRSQP
ncbi:MAG: DUF4325 domain-containing protein [Acidobacteria bacterium]|nr:DUF4325 domain-containing protein [Acidobacteriota bacterium]